VAGPELHDLLDGLGRVELGLGDLTPARRAFDEAARLEPAGWRPEPDARARDRRLAALTLACAGASDEALAELDAGLADATAGRGEEIAPLLHLRAQLLWHAGRDPEAADAAERCIAAAGRVGDADLVARGEDLAALAGSEGGTVAPLEPSTGLAERARQGPAPEHPVDVHLVLWDHDVLGGLGREALERRAARFTDRARDRDARDAVATGLLAQGTLALAAGRLDAAEATLRQALALQREAGSALGEALALERLGIGLGLRGRLDEALELLGDGVVAAERAMLRRHALVRLHAAEARNRLAAGATFAAEQALQAASEAAARHGDCVACDVVLRSEALRVALARGRPADAEAEAAALEQRAARRSGRGLAACARAARGRVLAAAGRREDALDALDAARTAYLGGGLVLEAARCARLEVRLRGPAALADRAIRALDALVVVDGDA
jgi:tetratricopeptide (TPR) repeat protein